MKSEPDKFYISPENRALIDVRLKELMFKIEGIALTITEETSEEVTGLDAMRIVSSQLLHWGLDIAVQRARLEGREPDKEKWDMTTAAIWERIVHPPAEWVLMDPSETE